MIDSNFLRILTALLKNFIWCVLNLIIIYLSLRIFLAVCAYVQITTISVTI